jgi:hypothetical protein
VYKRRVDSGAMTRQLADRELTAMIAIHSLLMKLKGLGFDGKISEEELALRQM